MVNRLKENFYKLLKVPLKRVQIYLNYYNDPLYREWCFNWSKRLLPFKDIHKGEDCFIIGNGPSLNKMDLSMLKDYYTFGLNKIYLIFDRSDLNLSYHVAVNPLVIEQSIDEIRKINCISFLSYSASHGFVHKNNYDNIRFIMTTSAPDGFQTDITCPIKEGATVTYVAMQLAYYMGFNNVFLIGMDHNFISTGTPNEIQFLNGADPNHFDPNYFGNNKWNLPDLEASELSYYLARFFFTRNGRQIFDATIDGKLNIFPKITFEEALNLCKKRK